MDEDKMRLMLQCMSAGLRSSCRKRQVGALILLNDEIISVGYNQKRGSPCIHAGICTNGFSHSCDKTVHAEMVALELARPKIDLHRKYNPDFRLSMFINISPCVECTRILLSVPELTDIFYNSEFKGFDEVSGMCTDRQVELTKVGLDEDFVVKEVITKMCQNGGRRYEDQ